MIECVPTVCNEMDCITVFEKAATKFFVEGILGRVCIRNESNGFASVVYYGLVALGTSVDKSYIESIIPLVGATFTPTNELSFNQKSAEIMMFSFEHNDYYVFGRFNFHSSVVRSKMLSRVINRLDSAIKSVILRMIPVPLGSLSHTVTADKRIHRVSFPEPRTVTLRSMKNGTKTCLFLMRQSLVPNVQASYVSVRTMTRNFLPILCQN